MGARCPALSIYSKTNKSSLTTRVEAFKQGFDCWGDYSENKLSYPEISSLNNLAI